MPQNNLSRRAFMNTAAVAAGSALLASNAGAIPLAPPDKQPPELKVPKTEPKKVGYAIVGLGVLALDEILPALKQCKKSTPVALVSGHPDKAKAVASAYGIDEKNIYSYDNYDKLADNPDVQAIYIVLPNHMHAEYTIRGFRAGKHVLCEKPLSATAEEAREMCKVAKETAKKFMTAYRLRYEPFNMKAIELVREGKIGKPQLFEAQNYQNVMAPNIRLSKATAGGPLGDTGVYCLNASRYILGEEPVEAMGFEHWPKDDERFAEVPAVVTFQLRFPSGALAVCGSGFNGQTNRRFRVTGTEGYIDLDPAFGYYGQTLKLSRDRQISDFDIKPVNHFTAEMDHFSQCILENKDIRTPGEDGLRDIIIMEAIKRSAQSGRVEKIDLASL